jgi:hypothetical protein
MPVQEFPQETYRRPLADGEADGARPAHQLRAEGVSAVRRWSNWSLAALVVGVAGSTAALARTIPSHPASTPTTVVPPDGTTGSTPATGSAGTTTAPGASTAAPSVAKPIAVTSPSGVTTYVMPGAARGTTAGGAAGAGVANYVARGDTGDT